MDRVEQGGQGDRHVRMKVPLVELRWNGRVFIWPCYDGNVTFRIVIVTASKVTERVTDNKTLLPYPARYSTWLSRLAQR